MVKQLVAVHMALRGGMKSSEQWRVCRQHRGGLQKGEIHVTAENKKNKRLEEEFYFAHQTIENRSKAEPKGFVRADSS